MLDLGFREDLDAILAKLPQERRSHLVSATFSRDVVSLADRFQHDPVHVQGTRLGEANVDIEHVVHLVEPGQRVDALVNLLLADEDAKSLVFVRTRADVARIAGELAEAGLRRADALGRDGAGGARSGPRRVPARAASRRWWPPTSPPAGSTSGTSRASSSSSRPPTSRRTRTGAAAPGAPASRGRACSSSVPSHYPTIARGLARAKIAHRVEPIPRPEAIQRAREEKLVTWLAREGDGDTIDPHAMSIAERIVESGTVLTALARLVEKAGLHGPTKARVVRALPPPREDQRPQGRRPPPDRRGSAPTDDRGWVTFRVTWGGLHGADARRLLAIACRRGNIRGSDVGAIRIEPSYSLLDVAGNVAAGFEAEAGRPDPRDPRVQIGRADGPPRAGGPPRHDRPSRGDGPPHHRPARPDRPPRGDGPPRHHDRAAGLNVPHRSGKPERPRPAAHAAPEGERRKRPVVADAPVRRHKKP